MSMTFYSVYASPKQLERLVNLIHLACVELKDACTERGLSFAKTVRECLHSANFWEQENIRCEMTSPTVFLASLTLSSIIFCCPTHPNCLFGRRQCCEITKEYEEACIWPSPRKSAVGSRECLYGSPLSVKRVYPKVLTE